MSIILDALRKSETERQRSETPGLADTRFIASPGRRSFWVPIIAIVLLANLLFMGVWWYQSSSSNPVPQIALPQQTTREEPLPLPVETQAPVIQTSTVRSLDQEVAPARPTAANRTEEQPPILAAPVKTSEPFQQATEPENTSVDHLPSLTQLTLSGDIVLPLLNIDLHVFSSNPTSRMVFINGDQYREGEQLEQGPQLSEITPLGVVLEYQGFRFELNKE